MAKKLAILVVLAGLLAASHAHSKDYSVGKGNWLVGAGVDVNRVWGGIPGRTTFSMTSEVGYFVYDFLMPQADFRFNVTEGYDAEIFALGARAYWNKGSRLLPFGKLTMGIGSMKSGDRYNAFALNPGIGVDYLVAPNVAVGLQIQYTAFIRSGTIHVFDVPIGLSFYF
jgi:opacity protein-like surface antigen